MKAFINGIGLVSGLRGHKFAEDTLFKPEVKGGSYIRCIEPDYKDFINPMLARRMSRMVKMGIFSAKSCLADAGIQTPDAIITGTGLGCLEDTEKFLISMIQNDEKLLNPSPFIQSTHNTVGSQVALFLQCHGYNLTYSHRGLSFENALLDALMLLKEEEAQSVLTGGVDELTDHAFQIQARLGIWNNDPDRDPDIIKHKSRGNIAGEGSSYLLLNAFKTDNSYASILPPKTFHQRIVPQDIHHLATAMLEAQGVSPIDIDLLLLGYGGDQKSDALYDRLREGIFSHTDAAYFKHLSGDYQTVTAFATSLAAYLMKTQSVPDLIKLGDYEKTRLQNILIYNHFNNTNHSFLLLQHV